MLEVKSKAPTVSPAFLSALIDVYNLVLRTRVKEKGVADFVKGRLKYSCGLKKKEYATSSFNGSFYN